jgi:hypothetical protein
MKDVSCVQKGTPLRVALLMLLAVAGLLHDARTQDSAASPSPKLAPDAKPILESNLWIHDYISGMDGAVRVGPQLRLRVFSDKTAELPEGQTATKRTTLKPGQFDKVRDLLEQPDLLAQKEWFCGYGGVSYEHVVIITLRRGEQQQLVTLSNFDPGYPGSIGHPAWPGQCPKIIVKLQCTVEGLTAQVKGEPFLWEKKCEEALAK